MAEASPIPLQTDTLSTLPGGGVRTLTVTVMVNGVPTPVLMQVVAIADAAGTVQGDLATEETLHGIFDELRAIRDLLAIIAQVPVLETSSTTPN